MSTLDRWLGQVHPGDCVEVMGKMPAESVGSDCHLTAIQFIDHHWWEIRQHVAKG